MRRKQSEVTDSGEIERILASATVGRLATLGADGYPYITPVNFVYDQGNFYFHCAPKGEKLDNIARNPRVCFEVDIPLAYFDVGFDSKRPICHLHQFYHCVVVRGTASVIQNEALKQATLNALVAKHEPGIDFNPVTEDMAGYKACLVIEVKPDSISAKSDLAQNRPQEDRRAIAEYLFKRNLPGDQDAVKSMGFSFH